MKRDRPDELDKKSSGSKEKKRVKKKFIIGVIFLLVVLATVVTLLLIFKNSKIKFDKNWQQIYFDYIKLDLIDNGVDENGKDVFARPYIGLMKNPEMVFIEDDYESPIMIIRGDLVSDVGASVCDKSISVSYIKDEKEKKVGTNLYYSAKDIVYLYNIETKEYNWYVKQESEVGDTYTRIIDIIENGIANDKIENAEDKKFASSYSFYENSTYNKFEEVFIEVSSLNSKYFDIKDDMKISDLKELIINSSDEIKKLDQVLTSDTKEKVEKELNAIEEKKAEEKQKAAEEESQKQAEEALKQQAVTSLKVGDYTLAYGTYKSLMAEAAVTITLNSGGYCNYVGVDPHSGNGNYDTTCTYQVVHEDIYGYGDMDYGIKLILNNGVTATFVVSSNNAFGSDWLAFSHS